MKILLLVFVLALAIYIANVICCAIFCESDENTQIAMPLVFAMPILVVKLFFYFLFADKDKGNSGLREAIIYALLPAKNYFMVQICANARKERHRQLAHKKERVSWAVPGTQSIADFFVRKMAYQGMSR